MGRSRHRRQASTRSPRDPWSVPVGAFLMVACQQPIGATETAASADATSSGGAQTTAAKPTTTGGSTGANASTTVGEGSGGDSNSEGSGSGGSGSGVEGECPVFEDPTTGAINQQVVEECDALCAHYQECGLKEHELCHMGCVAKIGNDYQDCYEAGSAARECLTAMTCEDLGEYLKFNEGGPCAQLLADQHETCTCQSQSGTHVGVDECWYDLDCPYVPFRRIWCHQGICECYVGEDVVKTCPQGDTCRDWLDLVDMAESCCCMVR